MDASTNKSITQITEFVQTMLAYIDSRTGVELKVMGLYTSDMYHTTFGLAFVWLHWLLYSPSLLSAFL